VLHLAAMKQMLRVKKLNWLKEREKTARPGAAPMSFSQCFTSMHNFASFE
jgi:hypothetical protein